MSATAIETVRMRIAEAQGPSRELEFAVYEALGVKDCGRLTESVDACITLIHLLDPKAGMSFDFQPPEMFLWPPAKDLNWACVNARPPNARFSVGYEGTHKGSTPLAFCLAIIDWQMDLRKRLGVPISYTPNSSEDVPN